MAPQAEPRASRPAGFWQRYAAWSLDAAVLALPAWWLTRAATAGAAAEGNAALGLIAAPFAQAAIAVLEGASPHDAAWRLLADPALTQAAARLQGALWQGLAPPVAAFAALGLAWHAGFERSRWQASPGKRALGLRVVDAADGRPPAPGRSVWRHLAGTASWLTLNVGHALAALPPRHLSLHDRLSATRVVARTRAVPPWAWAWIALQAAALLAAKVWLLARVNAALQAALDAALS